MASKKRIILIATIFACVVVISAIRAFSYYQKYVGFIEVCDNGIVYVPKGTQFVKCHGIVREIIFFETSISDDEECACADFKCCDGLCFVYVFTDPEVTKLDSKSTDESSEYSDALSSSGLIKIWLPC